VEWVDRLQGEVIALDTAPIIYMIKGNRFFTNDTGLPSISSLTSWFWIIFYSLWVHFCGLPRVVIRANPRLGSGAGAGIQKSNWMPDQGQRWT
jgi:hypothetical protein